MPIVRGARVLDLAATGTKLLLLLELLVLLILRVLVGRLVTLSLSLRVRVRVRVKLARRLPLVLALRLVVTLLVSLRVGAADDVSLRVGATVPVEDGVTEKVDVGDALAEIATMFTIASRVVADRPSSNSDPETLREPSVTVPASLTVNTKSALDALLNTTVTLPVATTMSSDWTTRPGQLHVPAMGMVGPANTAHRFTPCSVPSQHGASVPFTGTSAAVGRKGTRASTAMFVMPLGECADPGSSHTSAATGAAKVWHVACTVVPPSTVTPHPSQLDEQLRNVTVGARAVPSGNAKVARTRTGAPPSMVDGVLPMSGVSTAGLGVGLAVTLGVRLGDRLTETLVVRVAVGDVDLVGDTVTDVVPLKDGVTDAVLLKDGVTDAVMENVDVLLGLCSAVMEAVVEKLELGEILLVLGEAEALGVHVAVMEPLGVHVAVAENVMLALRDGDTDGCALSDARGDGLALLEKVGVLDLVGAGVTEGEGAGLCDSTMPGTWRGPAHSMLVVEKQSCSDDVQVAVYG